MTIHRRSDSERPIFMQHLAASLNQMVRQTENLHRIANALERIAKVLESCQWFGAARQ